MLYMLSFGTWDTYEPYIIEGPEVPDWRVYCESLVPETIDRAIQDYPTSYIGWSEMVGAMVKVLETRGYRRLRPPEAIFEGSLQIDGEDERFPEVARRIAPVNFQRRVQFEGIERAREWLEFHPNPNLYIEPINWNWKKEGF